MANKFPTLSKNFGETAGFPGVTRAIDATYANICPPSDQHDAYLDCTMKHSVILLVLCDASKNSPI